MIPTLITTQTTLARSVPTPSTIAPFLGLTVDVTLRLKSRPGSSSPTGRDIIAPFKVRVRHGHCETYLIVLYRTTFSVTTPLIS